MTCRRNIGRSSRHGWSKWRCEQRDSRCVIAGRVETTGLWQTIAELAAGPDVIEEVSRLVGLVNARRGQDVALLRSAVQTLRAIENEGFTFATEMELESVIEKLVDRGVTTD
jgi:hypothetical protein